MNDEVRERFILDDGRVVRDPDRRMTRQRNREVMAITNDREQKDRIGRKEALIEQYGEKKYDDLVRKTGGKILEDSGPYRLRR